MRVGRVGEDPREHVARMLRGKWPRGISALESRRRLSSANLTTILNNMCDSNRRRDDFNFGEFTSGELI